VGFFTLADLERVTGAKRRSLQLWADAGVIKARKGTDRAGTGTHRLFSPEEAVVACIVHAFAQHQIAIGELLIISERVGEAVRPSGGRKKAPRATNDELTNDEKKKAIILAAIEGDTSWLLQYDSWTEDVRAFEDAGSDWRTRYAVTAIKAGTTIATPRHLDRPGGFTAIICLATYLSKLRSHPNKE
jgi:hypothetical protein